MNRLKINKSLGGVLAAGALCLTAVAAQALTPFQEDVNAAIDDGLQYARDANWFRADTAAGNGLILLALLEKYEDGYAGLSDSDKELARNAACLLIRSGNYGARGSFYSYYDGQTLMALSVYGDTGGPNLPGTFSGYDCSAEPYSVRATMQKLADRSVDAQAKGTPTYGGAPGYWSYTGPGYDSSTTQLTAAGLGAAKAYFTNVAPADPARVASITAALDLTSAAYAVNGKDITGSYCNDTCDPAGKGQRCWGHGYQSYYGPGNNSNQQSSSATWLQLLGTGKNVNDAAIQNYLRWLQNNYAYSNNINPDSWPPAYFYYLWASSKAYGFIENSDVAPAAGNVGPAGMGTLPAKTSCSTWGYSREVNRSPAADTRPAPRGAGGAGYYAATPPGWYYDYAYRLMTLQGSNGLFGNPNGTWSWDADHAYALLVLLRSLGGACVDTDQDGVCDKDDNCPATPNPNQDDRDQDGVGDACDNCPNVSNPGQEDSNGNGIGDACEGKCDVDKDGDVDKSDTALISRARGKTVPPMDPAYDANGDGKIDGVDVKVCIPLCTRRSCAVR